MTDLEILMLVIAFKAVGAIIFWLCRSRANVFEYLRSFFKKISKCCCNKKEIQSNPLEITVARQSGLEENSSSLPDQQNEWDIEDSRVMEDVNNGLRELSNIQRNMEAQHFTPGLVVQLPPEDQLTTVPSRLAPDLDLPPSYDQLSEEK